MTGLARLYEQGHWLPALKAACAHLGRIFPGDLPGTSGAFHAAVDSLSPELSLDVEVGRLQAANARGLHAAPADLLEW